MVSISAQLSRPSLARPIFSATLIAIVNMCVRLSSFLTPRGPSTPCNARLQPLFNHLPCSAGIGICNGSSRSPLQLGEPLRIGGQARYDLLDEIAALVVGQCERAGEHLASAFSQVGVATWVD